MSKSGSNHKRVAAVIVTYNRKDLLKQEINCLLSQDYPCDILLVDNGSSDGTGEMVRDFLDDCRIRYQNTNDDLGSGAFQIGVEWAVKLGYEYIWIMDDDVQPEKEALLELMIADQELKGKWGFLSSVAYWTDGSYCKANIQKKGLFTFVNEKDYKKEIVPILMASYVSLLVKSTIVNSVGLPIIEYFMYTDDYEYTSRISSKYQGYMVPKSKVKHCMKENRKAKFATEKKARIYRYNYLYRNDVHCYRKYGLRGWIYIIGKDLKACADIIFSKTDSKMAKIGVIKKGFKEGLRFNPSIRYLHSNENE